MYKAHRVVEAAIKSSELIRPDVCSACDKPKKLHGHHDDYSKPLEVDWLCATCHKQRHKELGLKHAEP